MNSIATCSHHNEALNRTTFRIEPGEVVAIVGRSGSGKSTLANLLSRLYEPDKGTILVWGVDLADVDPGELRQRMGVVPQSVCLYQS